MVVDWSGWNLKWLSSWERPKRLEARDGMLEVEPEVVDAAKLLVI